MSQDAMLSVLGIYWAVLYPTIQLSIFAVLYAGIFQIKAPGIDTPQYVLMIFSGLVPLLMFNEALIAAITSIESKKALVANPSYPLEILPIRAVLASQIPGLIALVITCCFAIYLGHVHWSAVFVVPAMWTLLLLMACGVGSILALMNLIFKDVMMGIGLVTMVLLITSPFAYTPEMVPERLKIIIYANPLSYFVMVFQSTICFNEAPEIWVAFVALSLASLIFYLSFRGFQKIKNIFIDYA